MKSFVDGDPIPCKFMRMRLNFARIIFVTGINYEKAKISQFTLVLLFDVYNREKMGPSIDYSSVAVVVTLGSEAKGCMFESISALASLYNCFSFHKVSVRSIALEKVIQLPHQ